MKKFIIITSIFNPTEAVIAFAAMKEYKLIVVGDKKTPQNWTLHNVEYISIEQQEASGYKLSKIMPYNHYCRKMFGYLFAVEHGADLIIDTDDDNIPKTNWKFPDFVSEYQYIPDYSGHINIYELYSDQKIWPRGLPLRYVTRATIDKSKMALKKSNVGIWQGLADEDPDVDAVYRLISNQVCNFNEYPPVVLGKNSICPFNSQNTAIRKQLFPLLYLPTFVTFRFTDILRGLVAQPIMWLYNYALGFTNATVIQKRNDHDFMKDFESEIPMYLHAEKVVELVSAAISVNQGIENNLHNAYMALLRKGIVEGREIDALEAWLTDYRQCMKL